MQSSIGKKFQKMRSNGFSEMEGMERQAFIMAARCLLEEQEHFDDARCIYDTFDMEMPQDLVLEYARSQWQKRKYENAVKAYLIVGNVDELHTAGEKLMKKKDSTLLELSLKCFEEVGALDQLHILADKTLALAQDTKNSDLWNIALDAFMKLRNNEVLIQFGKKAMEFQQYDISKHAFHEAGATSLLNKLGHEALKGDALIVAASCFKRTKDADGLMRCAEVFFINDDDPSYAWYIFDELNSGIPIPIDFFTSHADSLLTQGKDEVALWFYTKISKYNQRIAKKRERVA